MAHQARRKMLIEPRLQLRFSLLFGLTASMAVVIQALIFATMMAKFASQPDVDGTRLMVALPEIVAKNALWTLAVLAPATLAVGILSTFRIVGPIYRMRRHLEALEKGERPGACTIRSGDELLEFCELLNRVTQPAASTPVSAVSGPAAGRDRQAA